jgi:hypothetical protein
MNLAKWYVAPCSLLSARGPNVIVVRHMRARSVGSDQARREVQSSQQHSNERSQFAIS